MNYKLPDVSETIEDKDRDSSEADRVWTEKDLENLISPCKAAGWIGALKRRFKSDLPERIRRGIGSSGALPSWMRRIDEEPVWLRNFLLTSDMAGAWFEHAFLEDDPQWLSRLIRSEEAKIARSFLISGNISDYVFDPVHGYRHFMRVLIDTLVKRKDCVLTYRLSRGLSVHSEDPAIRERLPKSILSELDTEGIHYELSLLTEICRLFDVLNRWLTGRGSSESGVDSGEFVKGVAVVIENVHLILPPQTSDIERNYLIDHLLYWSNSPELVQSSHCLIFTAESLEDVSSELRMRGGKIEQVSIPRPEDVRSRLKFVIPLLDPASNMKETRVSRMSAGVSELDGYEGTYPERILEFSHDTAGLNFTGIEDLIQQSLLNADKTLSRKTVMNLKRERLRQESDGVLELIDPRFTLDDVGGYSELKMRLREIIDALRSSHDALVRSTIPMGVLFLGPPGTGKSLIAESIAGESGINMVRLGDFRGMYVGQSEQNLSRIFTLIESLHPVIVLIDEIDQALGKRSAQAGDSGVDSRIFGRFLEFMSDTGHRGRILWIGASNFPDRIDPAMKRAGRFDLVLPILLPDTESRKRIIAILLEQELFECGDFQNSLSDADLLAVAEQTEGFTGAELRSIVGEVIRKAVREKMKGSAFCVNRFVFDDILSVYQPPKTQRDNYRRMEIKAVEDVSFTDLLPERFKRG